MTHMLYHLRNKDIQQIFAQMSKMTRLLEASQIESMH